MSKKEEGKPEPSLVYKSFIDGVARVRAYGVKKYGRPNDWRTTPSTRHFDAALRHLFAFMAGEELDEASNLSHLYHAAANIMFEIERREGPAVARRKKLTGERRVSVLCPRCGSRDDYPLVGVFPCTDECGYFIEPMLELTLSSGSTVMQRIKSMVWPNDLCAVCHKNPVDTANGFDTCDECSKKT